MVYFIFFRIFELLSYLTEVVCLIVSEIPMLQELLWTPVDINFRNSSINVVINYTNISGRFFKVNIIIKHKKDFKKIYCMHYLIF